MKQMIDPKSLNFDDKYLSLNPSDITDINTTNKGYVSFLNFKHSHEYNPTNKKLDGFIQLNAGEPSGLLIYTASTAQAINSFIRIGSSDSLNSQGSSDRLIDYRLDSIHRREYSKELYCIYPDPNKVPGYQYMLTDKTVKTIFGNSIYSANGTGNIDLYAHDITITKGTGKAFLTVYSSKNTNIDSLDVLKTIAGATFTKSCTGYINSKVIVAITETSFLLADGTTEALTGATFVDAPAAI